MAYHNTENTRLEIEVSGTGLPNLISNPSGALGAWGWVTPVANTNLTSDGTKLTFKTTVAQAAYFQSELMPIAVGRYASARVDLVSTVAGYARLRIEFLASDKTTVTGTGTYSAYTLITAGTTYAPTLQAPASTAYVRLRIDFYSSNAGANPLANWTMDINKAMVTHASSAAGLQTTKTNLVANPGFETNTTGWTGQTATLARVTTPVWEGTGALSLTTTGTSSIRATTASGTSGMAVTAGKDYTLSLYARSASGTRAALAQIVWYDTAGNFISNVWSSATLNTTYQRIVRTYTAPTNALYAAVQFVLTDGGSVGQVYYLDGVLFEQASSASAYFSGTTNTTAYEFVDPITWQNIYNQTTNIKVTLREFDTGLLSAEITDALLDPAVSTTIRPGKRIRLVELVAGVWQPVFTGKVTDASTSYPRDKAAGAKVRTNISLTASNNIAVLANQGEARGVQNVSDLPFILEGKGVPWNVNGSGSQVSSASIVAMNENASVIDQVEVTRASNHGYAWVNRQAVLCVYDSASIPTTTDYNFDDTNTNLGYSDIDVDYDLDSVINTVNVKLLVYDAVTGSTEEVPYTYVDQTSIDSWGARSAEFTVQGTVVPSTYAATILAANGTPVIKANSLVMPVKNATSAAAAAGIDLYTKVGVIYTGKVNTTYRVTGIEHTITPQGWDVVYEFGSTGAVAQPTYTPSPPATGALYDTGWVTPTLSNSWVQYGSGYQDVQYRRIGNKVILRGLTKSGVTTDGTAIFTLPTDCRPLGNLLVSGIVNNIARTSGAASTGTAHTHTITTNDVASRINISSAGVVSIGANTMTVGNGYLSFTGIEFYVD